MKNHGYAVFLAAILTALSLSLVLLTPVTTLAVHAQETAEEQNLSVSADDANNADVDDGIDNQAPAFGAGQEQTAKQVADALGFIYRDQADVLVNDYADAAARMRQSCCQELLDGVYSKNAVAVFLDHGYFSDKFAEISRAGLLPEGYRLPERTYSITRTNELMRIPQKGDTSMRYVIVTDSPYLQTYQLEEIAAYHDFDELEMYCDELMEYEDAYLPKAQWIKSADNRP